uniref:Uncharacterized protein n=1 Tax=Heterorhabditis bacteriophora TaxID=37862 RepID=A0A1I7X0D5_HETBA
MVTINTLNNFHDFVSVEFRLTVLLLT